MRTTKRKLTMTILSKNNEQEDEKNIKDLNMEKNTKGKNIYQKHRVAEEILNVDLGKYLLI